jgi:hypothetical protein
VDVRAVFLGEMLRRLDFSTGKFELCQEGRTDTQHIIKMDWVERL